MRPKINFIAMSLLCAKNNDLEKPVFNFKATNIGFSRPLLVIIESKLTKSFVRPVM